MRTAVTVVVLVSFFFVVPGPWQLYARKVLELLRIRRRRDRMLSSVESSAAYFDSLAPGELVAAERARRPDPRAPARSVTLNDEGGGRCRRAADLLRPQARARARGPRSGEPTLSDLRREASRGPDGEPQSAPKVPVVPAPEPRPDVEPLPALRIPPRGRRRARPDLLADRMRAPRPPTTSHLPILRELWTQDPSPIRRMTARRGDMSQALQRE